jgi:hypothetical protein
LVVSVVHLFTQPLTQAGIAYAVTGSVAGSAFGEPRMTLDIDIVVGLRKADVQRFAALYPAADFYCPPEVMAVEAARPHRGHFNVIHHYTGFKADIYPAGNDALMAWALRSPQVLVVDGQPMSLAPPEYVIVKKLEFHREGGSAKHITDIEAIVRQRGDRLDIAKIVELTTKLGLLEAWHDLNARR